MLNALLAVVTFRNKADKSERSNTTWTARMGFQSASLLFQVTLLVRRRPNRQRAEPLYSIGLEQLLASL